MISEEKKKIVIENYFKSECNMNTSIHDAYVKGFERGLSKAPQPEHEAVNYICTGYADGHPVYDEAECPCCGRIYEEGDMAWDKAKYCMSCGQPLLWQEEEE